MSKRENEFICPCCGEVNDADLDFCEFCGEDLRPEEVREKEPARSGGCLSTVALIVLFLLALICLSAKQ